MEALCSLSLLGRSTSLPWALGILHVDLRVVERVRGFRVRLGLRVQGEQARIVKKRTAGDEYSPWTFQRWMKARFYARDKVAMTEALLAVSSP